MISLRDDGLNDDPKDLGVYTKGPVVPSAVPTLLVEQVGNDPVSDTTHEYKVEALPGGDPIGPRRRRRNDDAQNK
jgi:hypothetical protein